MTDGTDDILETDQWANTVGDDGELEGLWAALMEATSAVEAKALDGALAQYLAGLGARSRRTTEGLILAATAATATEGPGWEDWRVILHRHFIRDERMDLAVAAAILLELRKAGANPDWHAAPERVMERVIGSLVRDMLRELDAIEEGAQATAPSAVAASGFLATLASELFDVSISVSEDQREELENSPAVAELLGDLLRQLSERGGSETKQVATNLVKARALVEVTMRQLELGSAVVH
ncbi:hypothetical protein [Acidisoma sp.]|uniref:hypothetical protein n=1 Tax=Acidisoma sp. TaxID=1872115 RepID=UPI003B00B375